ncbi:hypothetical protein ACWENQ_42775 [Nonomuraea sp. NPDC004354]
MRSPSGTSNSRSAISSPSGQATGAVVQTRPVVLVSQGFPCGEHHISRSVSFVARTFSAGPSLPAGRRNT